MPGCDSGGSPTFVTPIERPQLTGDEVQTLIARAVEQAERQNTAAVIAVSDREANILGVFRMTGSAGSAEDPTFGAIAKARTAAYLSSNQHGFTSLTACFITRSHFPPGIDNTAGGPLYGVPFSSLGGGDVQPNGGAVLPGRIGNGEPGLTGVSGGLPVFKDGLLAGALGVSTFADLAGLPDNFLSTCSGSSKDELIALGAAGDFSVPKDKRGDNIFLDGIRLLFANARPPAGNFTLTFADLTSRGEVEVNYPIRAAPEPRFPVEGEVNLMAGFDFTIKGNDFLSAQEVRQIIDQAVEQANKTRAAIRRPIGTPARVFVTVVDKNGTILGIWRTRDATLFSYDVSAQKARTVVAFSDPNTIYGQQVRRALGLPENQEIAFTCRALGFVSQRFFPPGIDVERLGRPLQLGPFFIDSAIPFFDFERQAQIGLGQPPLGNGITIFPGAVALYKNGELVGGVGVSGDGVDQDDIIAFAGGVGFEPAQEIRCDQFFVDGIRLPYVKFPRRPEIEQ
ncbi:MAG: heme-binding protein [bacterium]